MNGNGGLQRYCDAVDRVFEDHGLNMHITGGRVDKESGVVSFRVDLKEWKRMEDDLARALGVQRVRLFFVVEARTSDNGEICPTGTGRV